MTYSWCLAACLVLEPLTSDVQIKPSRGRPGDFEVWATYHGERDDDQGECASVIAGLPDLLRFLLAVQGIKAWHYDAGRGQSLQSALTDETDYDDDDAEPEPPEPESWDGTYDGEDAPVHDIDLSWFV